MREALRIIGLLLAALVAWVLLGPWLRAGSERFYLLVPPVFLGLFLLAAPDGWRGLRRKLRPAGLYLAGLLIFCTAYSLQMVMLIAPPPDGAWSRALCLRELLVMAYFLVAVKLLLGAVWGWLRRSVLAAHGRCFGAPASEDGLPAEVPLLPQVLAPLLLLPLLLPYALGALYVHRLKIPNTATPRDVAGRDYEDVAFVTADGLTLRGWFVPAAEPSERTVLICHGLGANRSNFLPFLQVAVALGANALLFDFRGHGDSDGHTVTMGYAEKQDVLAAVAYLRDRRPGQARQLVGLGISMGTSGLIRAAAEVDPPLDAVVLDSAYASAVELADNVLGAFPALVRPGLIAVGVPLASLEAGCWLPDVRPIDQVEHLRAPVLFIHAAGDRLIPAEHSRRLYERAREPKTLWIVDEELHGHALFRAPAEYRAAVTRLLEPASLSP